MEKNIQDSGSPMIKRVLLITQWYYPCNEAAAHRPAKFAKYLQQSGWTPAVLCVDWTPENSHGTYDPSLAAGGDCCEVIRIPRRSPRRRSLWSIGRRLANMVWPYRTPYLFCRRMVAAAIRRHREQPFDVIWSTQPDQFVHYIARTVAERTGIPWVADFRDLPDELASTWRSRLAMRLLIRATSTAKALVTVTQAFADHLSAMCDAPMRVITNGFDPDDYPVSRKQTFAKFTISYFGILSFFRDPEPLFVALDLLAQAGRIDLADVRVEFFGSEAGVIARRVGPHKCKCVVECKNRVPHDEVVRRQQESVVLLGVSTPGDRGFLPSKMLAYLAARRPILNLPGDGGVVDLLIAETGAGRTARTPEAIAEILEAWYREWKATGTVQYRGNEQAVAKYSYVSLARQLADLLDSVGGPMRQAGQRLSRGEGSSGEAPG